MGDTSDTGDTHSFFALTSLTLSIAPRGPAGKDQLRSSTPLFIHNLNIVGMFQTNRLLMEIRNIISD